MRASGSKPGTMPSITLWMVFSVPAGLFAYLNPAYTGLIDAAGINTALLTFGDFIFANLIPVTLGNIVGGVAVGLVMYACHGTKRA